MNTFHFIGLIRSFRYNRYPKLDKIASMGLLGVRIAQEYSQRIDILSESMCYYLMDIHSSLLPNDPKNFLKILKPKSDIFYNLEFFDNEPVSHSHVTQVYQGTLRDGVDCGIKVIDEKSKREFIDDINSLEKGIRIFATVAPRLTKKYFAIDVIEKIKSVTLDKMNLKKEIAFTGFLAGIKKDYEDVYDLSNLYFPRLYRELSTDNYIVGEYIHGRNVKELLTERKMKYQKYLEIMRYHFFYIFAIGTFHSDIHGANIIIGEKGEVYFIDCNSLSNIEVKFRVHFYKFLIALSTENFKTAAQEVNNLSSSLITARNYSNFEKKVKDIFAGSVNKKMKEFSFSKSLMSLFKCATEQGMRFDESLFPLLKAIIRMEEMGHEILPEAYFQKNLLEILETYDESFISL